jgi:hypothetical protein
MSLFQRIPEDRQRDGVTHQVSGRGALTIVGLLVGAVVLLVVLFVVVVVVMASTGGGKGTDCDAFRVAPGEWQGAAFERRQELADGIIDCGTLEGEPAAEAERLLGAPDERSASGLVYRMPYGGGSGGASYLTLTLQDGRVDGAKVDGDTGGGRIP